MQKNYHLDTNVLLEREDAINILRNGEENKINISITVINELDHLLKDNNKRPKTSKAIQNI
jgi:predicted ribonuclease YlaK